jgi:hypothetical protein
MLHSSHWGITITASLAATTQPRYLHFHPPPVARHFRSIPRSPLLLHPPIPRPLLPFPALSMPSPFLPFRSPSPPVVDHGVFPPSIYAPPLPPFNCSVINLTSPPPLAPTQSWMTTCLPTAQTRGRRCAPARSSRPTVPAPGAPSERRPTRQPAPARSRAKRRQLEGSRRTRTGTTPLIEGARLRRQAGR